jgi:hypothetical protein
MQFSTDFGRRWERLYPADLEDYPGDPNGKAWIINLENLGAYDVTIRQFDTARNVSLWSKPISFFWDRGALLERIDTFDPNRIYTTNNEIRIDLHFRRPLHFSQTSYIYINAEGDPENFIRRLSAPPQTFNPLVPALPEDYILSFIYRVQAGDSTLFEGHYYRLNVSLKEDSFTGVFDSPGTGATDVTFLINLDKVHDVATDPPEDRVLRNLKDLKNIRVNTGMPGLVSHRFITTGISDPATPGFTGGQHPDGTYWAIFEAVYDDYIFRGPTLLDRGPLEPERNVIRIEQLAGGYRLPAVLTEAQRTRFIGHRPG